MCRGISTILVVVAAVIATAQSQDLGSCTRGRATFYDASSSGTCGFLGHSGTLNFAPNSAFFAGSAVCGECFEVTGPKGSYILMADNLCPVSGNEEMCSGDITHFDINSNSFGTIAETTWGVTNMQYRPVVCPTTAPISVIVHGANAYYLQVVIFNHKVGITAVSVRDATATSWTQLSRTDYNAWEWSAGREITYPVIYSVTSKFGESIEITIPSAPTPNQKIDGTTQFTQWTTVPGTDNCPTLYEFDIYVNKLNDGSPQSPAQYWNADTANWAVTSGLPPSTTAAAQKTIASWGEWPFFTRGSPTASIPLDHIEAVELQIKSTEPSIQLVWGQYSDGKIVNFPTLSNSWSYHKFNVSQFGSNLSALSRIAFKNNSPNSNIQLTIANFRVIRSALSSPPTSTTSPVSTPTASPVSTPTVSPNPMPASSPTVANPPTSQPIATTPSEPSPDSSSTPTGANGPSSLASENASLTIYALFSIIALTLLVNF